METSNSPPSEAARLRRAADGDPAAWAELIEPHRARLRRMVALRLDRRLLGRVDASDVIQEASIAAVHELPSYLSKPDLPLFLWLRMLVDQSLALHHRKHLGVQAQNATGRSHLYRERD